jgi:hypothetical protein
MSKQKQKQTKKETFEQFKSISDVFAARKFIKVSLQEDLVVRSFLYPRIGKKRALGSFLGTPVNKMCLD